MTGVNAYQLAAWVRSRVSCGYASLVSGPIAMIPTARFGFFYFYGFFRLAERVERRA